MKNKIDVRGISQQQALNQLEKALEDQSIKTVEILSSEQDSTSTLINYLSNKGVAVEEVLQTPEGQTIIANISRKQIMTQKSYV